jgi:hypothetical protein
MGPPSGRLLDDPLQRPLEDVGTRALAVFGRAEVDADCQ